MDQMMNIQKKKTTNKNSFLSSAGQIDIDENALTDLREASVTQETVLCEADHPCLIYVTEYE